MNKLSLLIGKVLIYIGDILKRGSSLPGYIAIRIAPDFLKNIDYPDTTIVISGTNGKTSTTNMIASIMKHNKMNIVFNKKGANLLTGIITTIIKKTNLNLKMDTDTLLLEVDELTVPKFFKYKNPNYFLITNFFKDQVDRHGDVFTLVDKILKSIHKDTILILNANDPYSSYIGESLEENTKIYYGVDYNSNYNHTESTVLCPFCGNKLNYNKVYYEHLGIYICSNCSFSTPKLDVIINNIDLDKGFFTVNDFKYEAKYNNLYSIYNLASAVILANELNIDYKTISESVKSFDLGEGRLEKITFNNHETFINLVKNSAGLNESLTYILNDNRDTNNKFIIIFAFNNMFADGIDTSWVWDVDFSILIKENKLDKFICSGERAYDLAVRLECSEIPKEDIVVFESIYDSLEYSKKIGSKPYMLSSYSKLQSFKKSLSSFSGGE